MSRTRIIGLTIAMLAIAIGGVLGARSAAHAGGVCAQPPTDAQGVAVDIKELCYQPTVIRADVGQTITWTNNDAVAHTVTSANERSGAGGWGNAEEIQLGQSVSHTFDHAGVYPYYCHVHIGMIGAVVVGDGNAAAFPGEAGGAQPTAPASAPRARAGSGGGGIRIGDLLAFAALGTLGVVLAGGVGWRLRARRRG